MKIRFLGLVLTSVLLMGNDFSEVKLKSITPDDLIQQLHLQEVASEGYQFNLEGQQVKLLINRSTNKILILGPAATAQKVSELVQFLDVPSRQIMIEVQIIDVNKQMVSDLGINWQEFLNSLNLGAHLSLSANETKNTSEDPSVYTRGSTNVSLGVSFNSVELPIGKMINMLVNSGAARITSSPRIVTINNRQGSIVDGDHTTFVAKYSTYGEVYETKELYTGLSLAVTPSIGDNNYLSLDIEAKYTNISGTISGNPVETGQILNNHVIVKNDEPFLLGAFKRNATQAGKRKIPILGTILPYLFSNKSKAEVEQDFLIVVTPTIIDLSGSEVPTQTRE